MTKTTRAARRQHRGRHVFLRLLGGLVVLVVLGIVFFTPLNNAWRNATGADTPADTAIKNTVADKIAAAKTGDANTDALIDAAANAVKNTPTTTIMQAAQDPNKMAAVIQQKTGVPTATAQAVAAQTFSDPTLNQIRTEVAQGNYTAALSAYENLTAAQKESLKHAFGR